MTARPPERAPADLRVTLSEDAQGLLAVFSFASDPEQAVAARSGGRLPQLTPAEAHVLALLVEGHGLDAIAQARGTSLSTVRKQLESLYRKLGVHSRGELAALLWG